MDHPFTILPSLLHLLGSLRQQELDGLAGAECKCIKGEGKYEANLHFECIINHIFYTEKNSWGETIFCFFLNFVELNSIQFEEFFNNQCNLITHTRRIQRVSFHLLKVSDYKLEWYFRFTDLVSELGFLHIYVHTQQLLY